MEHLSPSERAVREAIRRAVLPPILFVADLRAILRLSASGARRAVLRGECGRFLRVGRRIAVSREAFSEALRAREVAPLDPRARPSWKRTLRGAGRATR